MHDAFIETLYYVVVADLLCALLPCQHIMKNHGTVGAGRSEPGLWENLSIYLSIDQQLGMRRRPCISRHGAKCVDGDRNGIQAVRSPSTSISFTAAMLRRRRHVARAGGARVSRARACVQVEVGRRPPSRQATVEVDMKGAPARARWIGANDMSEGRSHALHLNEEQT